MSWTDLRDQDGAAALLQRAIATARVAPAYLFVGPASVGKARAARLFAQALNCEQTAGAACGTCDACRTTASHNHPDLLWTRPEKRSRTIPVAAARLTIRALALAPQAGRYRVAVFDDADCLHPTAQNALLKTLEEPPSRSLVLLVTSHPEGLLPTVRSRCQLVRFRPLAPATVADLLAAEGVPAESARLAAAAAPGGVAPARLLAQGDRLAFLRANIERALAGDSAGAAADHARDLDRQEKALEKHGPAAPVAPELLSREQRKRMEEEQVARVQREMAERTEADAGLLALAVRDGLVLQAAGTEEFCTLGTPLPAFAAAEPARLVGALREIDRGVLYLRRFIRRDRVLFALYSALEHAGRAAAA